MVKGVIFSPIAIKNTKEIIQYLKKEWSDNSANRFINILREKISIIKEYPNSYNSLDGRENIRRCVITKQTTLYYKIGKNKIEVITSYDSRQNPDNLKKFIWNLIFII